MRGAPSVWLAAALLGAPVPSRPQPAPPLWPWAADVDPGVPTRPLAERFPAPSGFSRVEAPAGGFAAFLRTLPVRLDRKTVLDFRGQPLARPAAAVVHLDVGRTDAQQCADTAIRLFAEWRWQAGHARDASFHFTSGHRTRFADWVAGERFTPAGASVTRSRGARRASDHASYRRWLDQVFRYAGTRSLRLDTREVPADAALAAGDLFIDPGSPGHAVILLDLARAPDGRFVALVGQGYMPAEDLHVLEAPAPVTLESVWFVLPRPGEALATPSWRAFPRESARRFEIERR